MNASPSSFSSVLPNVKSSYQPHLDGLRGLAILGVLADHFGLPLPPLLHVGPVGVRFFFVLTGYFITLSLCRLKNTMGESTEENLMHLGRFYFGRLLRIGPPFYLALLIGAFVGIEEVRTNFLWLATFQVNNYIVHLGYWPNAISHFWSLAVQEQFYILWPLVVLTLPRRWFFLTMSLLIFFSLGFRIGCILTNAPEVTRWVTLFGCFDSFAVGALIAHFKESKALEKIKSFSKTMLLAIPLVASSCYFVARALTTLPADNAWLALAESFDAIFLAWLLVASLGGIKSRYGQFLCWSPMVYLGRISYGVYVYHVFIILMISPLLEPYGMSENHYAAGRIFILLMLTLISASLSWHFMEKPFIAWKDELAGRRRQPALAPSAV